MSSQQVPTATERRFYRLQVSLTSGKAVSLPVAVSPNPITTMETLTTPEVLPVVGLLVVIAIAVGWDIAKSAIKSGYHVSVAAKPDGVRIDLVKTDLPQAQLRRP